MCIGALVLRAADTAGAGYLGGSFFGLGVGGMLTLLPVIWADYFGRSAYGAIRGAALSLQVLAQAAGPLAAGTLRDFSGAHAASLALFATLAAAGVAVALMAQPPRAA
jgi:hypothetical protein